MNIDALLNAGDVIDQWKSSNHHVAPWTESQIYEIVQTYDFQVWFSNHPNGTIDQYYVYLCNRQAYLNSPQYRIKNLEERIDNMSGEVVTLNKELSHLKEELVEKEDEIFMLRAFSCVTLTTSFILMILSCVLLYKLRKRNK